MFDNFIIINYHNLLTFNDNEGSWEFSIRKYESPYVSFSKQSKSRKLVCKVGPKCRAIISTIKENTNNCRKHLIGVHKMMLDYKVM